MATKQRSIQRYPGLPGAVTTEGATYHPWRDGLWAPDRFQVHSLPEDYDAPRVIAHFSFVGEVPQCRRLEILATSRPTSREILDRDLRGLPATVKLEHWIEFALRVVAFPEDLIDAEGRPDFLGRGAPDAVTERRVDRTTRSVRKQARRGLSDQLLREVAQVYRANVDSNPTASVAHHFARHHRTAGLYIKSARERIDPETGEPFLGRATKGRAGEQ